MSLTEELSHENPQFQDTANKKPGTGPAETSYFYLKVALKPQGRDTSHCFYRDRFFRGNESTPGKSCLPTVRYIFLTSVTD